LPSASAELVGKTIVAESATRRAGDLSDG